MGDFGFDPYIVSNLQTAGNQNSNNDMQTLADLVGKRTQNQVAQYGLQRQRTLADIVSQNAGAFSNPYAHAMAQGGFGQEAFEAQRQALEQQAQYQSMMQNTAAVLRSRAAMVKTPEQAKQYLGGISPSGRDYLGLPDPEDPQALQKIQDFRASAISPEQQATNAIKERELEKDRFDVKDIDGIPYKIDKVTGKAFPLGGGAPVGGDVPAPLGSKRGSQKDAMLKSLAEDLDPTNGRSDLAVKANAQIAADQRLEAAINAPGPMTAQRLHEITLMTATIANGGNVPTEAQVEAMYPKTLKGRGAEFWQSTTGVPTDVGAKAFVDQMRAQSTRETAVAKKQIRNYLLGRLANHPQAFQNFPNEANQMAEEAGLKGLYDGKTGRPLPRVTAPDHDAAAEWLRSQTSKMDPNYARALAAYKMAHGGAEP